MMNFETNKKAKKIFKLNIRDKNIKRFLVVFGKMLYLEFLSNN